MCWLSAVCAVVVFRHEGGVGRAAKYQYSYPRYAKSHACTRRSTHLRNLENDNFSSRAVDIVRAFIARRQKMSTKALKTSSVRSILVCSTDYQARR